MAAQDPASHAQWVLGYSVPPEQPHLANNNRYRVAVQYCATASSRGILRRQHRAVWPAVGREEKEKKKRDVYFARGVHVRILSLGRQEGQGWDTCLKARNRAAGSGGGGVRCRQQGEQRLSNRAQGQVPRARGMDGHRLFQDVLYHPAVFRYRYTQ